MAAYYIDSSALAKRYVAEPGSAWFIRLTDPVAGHDLYSVTLTGPELIAASARRARGGQLSPALAVQAIHDFRRDWELQYQALDADDQVISRAMDVAEVHALRGYDAVHVATALELRHDRQVRGLSPLTFVSADRDQLRVAAAEGLSTEDPNQYT